MNASRFFRIVRRFNSLIPLGAVLAGVLALLVGLAGTTWDHLARRAARTESPAPSDDRLALDSPVAIAGTPVTVLPLNGIREEKGFSSGYAGTWTRNLLFHDVATGRMHWLRPDDTAAIVDRAVLREGEVPAPYEDAGGRGAEGKGAILGIRYELAEADTDGDEVIGAEDRLQLALSTVAGGALTVLLRDVDEIRGYSAPAGGRLAVFFRRGEEERVAEIDLAARRVLREAAIPGR